MLDIAFIRAHTDRVKEVCRQKNNPVDIDQLLRIDEERRTVLHEYEDIRAQKSAFSKELPTLPANEKKSRIADMQQVAAREHDLETKLSELGSQFEDLLFAVPNMPSDDTPVGKDDSENAVLRSWGEKPSFSFKPKEHWELGAALDVIDTPRATKVSGARFAYLKGDLALLEFALIRYAMDVLSNQETLSAIAKKFKLDVPTTPFIPVIPPVLIKPDAFKRMARLEPREERYHIPSDDLYLIGSAEHTLGAMHMDETLNESQLPLRYAGFSVSLRREAGSYGKDTKGILRLHQFDKVEMESFTVGEASVHEQDFFVAIQEYLMQSLGIPYQVIIACTGDMGDPDARHIDIESWMPGQDRYRETHSADLITDYQARRWKTKVKRASGAKEFVHMNDGTAFAIGRTLIAIMENNQQADGSFRIPEILVPYMNGKTEVSHTKK